MSAPLTKKQLKTLAFRAKQKNQAAPVDDVPEVDLLDDDEAVPVPEPAAEGSKKRKREDDPNGKGKAKEVAAEGEEVDGDKETEEQKKKKSKKDVKQRFILFVGNLGFRTTAKQIAVHFKEAVGKFKWLVERSNRYRSRTGCSPFDYKSASSISSSPSSSSQVSWYCLHRSAIFYSTSSCAQDASLYA